jgi:uncharacterized protein YjbI with pentapeptide repeats
MANLEQLNILKQGVDIWNAWRFAHRLHQIDLGDANLKGLDLQGINLESANLNQAKLQHTNLARATLQGADLVEANLSYANLVEANLVGAHLNNSILEKADLRNAQLVAAELNNAELQQADLGGANLRDASLVGAKLLEASLALADLHGAEMLRAELDESGLYRTFFDSTDLRECSFRGADLLETIFVWTDLSEALHLESVKHSGPSSLSADTIKLSKGKIPQVFLRGCGLSDWEIQSAKLYQPDLTNDQIIDIQYEISHLRTQPLQISGLFISYSHEDSTFVDELEKYLNTYGIRFWRDLHHATSGKLEKIIDRAIRLNPTVLLILSRNSVESDWVEHEVNRARILEKSTGRDVLCPIALDAEWKKPNSWSPVLLDQVTKYNIVDFSEWMNAEIFKSKFSLLLNGLDLFYKK